MGEVRGVAVGSGLVVQLRQGNRSGEEAARKSKEGRRTGREEMAERKNADLKLGGWGWFRKAGIECRLPSPGGERYLVRAS